MPHARGHRGSVRCGRSQPLGRAEQVRAFCFSATGDMRHGHLGCSLPVAQELTILAAHRELAKWFRKLDTALVTLQVGI